MQVNARLSREALQWGEADPAHPKALWPNSAQCPQCYLQPQDPAEPFAAVWDYDKVGTPVHGWDPCAWVGTLCLGGTPVRGWDPLMSVSICVNVGTSSHCLYQQVFDYLVKHFGVGESDDEGKDESGLSRRGGVGAKQAAHAQEGAPEAAWVWQVVVVVTVVALVAYITCGCGESVSGKPVYAALTRDAETSPQGVSGRAVSPPMQPLAALLHSALHTSSNAKKQ